MTIGEVAKRTGVTTSAIRFYESAGILPPPERKNGIRRYDLQTVERIRTVQFLRGAGVSIRGLASMFSNGGLGSEESCATVRRRIDELDCVIAQANLMKARLQQMLSCTCDGDTQRCVIFR